MINDNEQLEIELRELEQEHNELNEIIDDPDCHTKFPQFTLQKIKNRKLLVKDKIEILKDLLYPDIIA